MSDSVDIRGILAAWPYDSENDARIVRGDDGREILQVRTPVGIEQYEMDGRPDGARPRQKESILECFQDRLASARAAGTDGKFKLTAADCAELFNEGTLYYFRYARLFQLKDWDRTARDTARNLRAFDLVHTYAEREEDRQFLERWRPYVLWVNSSASAMIELDRQRYDDALRVIHEALQKIEALEELDDDTFRFERGRAVKALRNLVTQIQRNRPLSELERLEQRLKRAIERQEFERAAELRDRIRELKKPRIV